MCMYICFVASHSELNPVRKLVVLAKRTQRQELVVRTTARMNDDVQLLKLVELWKSGIVNIL